MGNLVEIAQFFDPEEAYCAKGYLQSYGIESIFQNEHHLTMAPWLRVALGGYRLLVMADFEDEARQALKDVSALSISNDPARTSLNSSAVDPQESRTKNWIWLPVAFLSAVPFLPSKKTGWIAPFQFLVLLGLYAGLIWSLPYWFGYWPG